VKRRTLWMAVAYRPGGASFCLSAPVRKGRAERIAATFRGRLDNVERVEVEQTSGQARDRQSRPAVAAPAPTRGPRRCGRCGLITSCRCH
jgi:hypothetical protein